MRLATCDDEILLHTPETEENTAELLEARGNTPMLNALIRRSAALKLQETVTILSIRKNGRALVI